ncbi:MAG: hypothetical protein H7Z37_10685 [Pyrinomonadaceae bacterium]|nr:hypothetical protein [Pyrinomonadaceae bacterium]
MFPPLLSRKSYDEMFTPFKVDAQRRVTEMVLLRGGRDTTTAQKIK